jgi:hypothetical protein
VVDAFEACSQLSDYLIYSFLIDQIQASTCRVERFGLLSEVVKWQRKVDVRSRKQHAPSVTLGQLGIDTVIHSDAKDVATTGLPEGRDRDRN